MTVGEQRFMEVVQHSLQKIAAELERSNKLKEYELRSQLAPRRGEVTASHNELDRIMGKDHR